MCLIRFDLNSKFKDLPTGLTHVVLFVETKGTYLPLTHV